MMTRASMRLQRNCEAVKIDGSTVTGYKTNDNPKQEETIIAIMH